MKLREVNCCDADIFKYMESHSFLGVCCAWALSGAALSSFLIVCCARHSACSPYVCKRFGSLLRIFWSECIKHCVIAQGCIGSFWPSAAARFLLLLRHCIRGWRSAFWLVISNVGCASRFSMRRVAQKKVNLVYAISKVFFHSSREPS